MMNYFEDYSEQLLKKFDKLAKKNQLIIINKKIIMLKLILKS